MLFDKLDTAKMHGLDNTSNVSCRGVTSNVEFGLKQTNHICSDLNWLLLRIIAPPPPLLQMAGHRGTMIRRTANKKLTKLY